MFYAIVDRFGYEHMTIGKTKKAVKERMISWYVEEFKAFNDGLSPKDCFEYGERSNYEVFIDELAINKINYDEVITI